MISGQLVNAELLTIQFYDLHKPKREHGGPLFDRIQQLERRYDGRPLPLELTIPEAQELASAFIAWSGAMPVVWMTGHPRFGSVETIMFKEHPISVLKPFEFREGAD